MAGTRCGGRRTGRRQPFAGSGSLGKAQLIERAGVLPAHKLDLVLFGIDIVLGR